MCAFSFISFELPVWFEARSMRKTMRIKRKICKLIISYSNGYSKYEGSYLNAEVASQAGEQEAYTQPLAWLDMFMEEKYTHEY